MKEDLLTGFFGYLGKYDFEKAKDVLDKEREISRSGRSVMWMSIVEILSQFASAEKAYSSLDIFGPKWLHRKDCRVAYALVMTELTKIREAEHSHRVEEAMEVPAHICNQLVEFVEMRTSVILIYEQFVTATLTKPLVYSDLLERIGWVKERATASFHHPILVPLKEMLMGEIGVLQCLISANIALSEWSFFDSLLHLLSAHQALGHTTAMVSASLQQREQTTPPHTSSWSFSFGAGGSTKSTGHPQLLLWLRSYLDTLLSKFGFYFANTLSQQMAPLEGKNLLPKTTGDYSAQLLSLHKRTGAAYTGLMMDASQLSDYGRKSAGYSSLDLTPSSGTLAEPPLTGTGSYPMIISFSHSQDASGRDTPIPNHHLVSLIMIVTSNEEGKTVAIPDESNQTTYFLVPVEAKMSLVAVYESCKRSKECKEVLHFLQDLAAQLLSIKLFSKLKGS